MLHLSLHSDRDGLIESHIEFAGVSLYHFLHTEGAIITEINEEPIRDFATKEEAFLSAAAHDHGLRLWRTNTESYIARLEEERMRVWTIKSAIGFTGFVIARLMAQKEDS